MFFLRCAFFLSLVYSSMSWTNGALEAPAAAFGSGRLLATSVMNKAVSGASDLCSHHTAECFAEAARITALLESDESTAQPAVEPSSASVPLPPSASVPLPVPDPRRHGRDAKLARAL